MSELEEQILTIEYKIKERYDPAYEPSYKTKALTSFTSETSPLLSFLHIKSDVHATHMYNTTHCPIVAPRVVKRNWIRDEDATVSY